MSKLWTGVSPIVKEIVKRLVFASLTFLIPTFLYAQTEINNSCAAVMRWRSDEEARIEPLADAKQFVVANNVMVTGGELYPLKVILNGLDLSDKDLVRLKGQTVLSLAEGYSDFLPHLLYMGADVYGLDIWYHQKSFPLNETGNEMRRYMQRFGDRLIQGSAFDIPVYPDSMDLVVSHQLVNNFTFLKERLEVLKEAIRVCKVGGQVRIFGMGSGSVKEVEKYLKENYGRSIKAKFKRRISNWTSSSGRILKLDGPLWIIDKKSSLNLENSRTNTGSGS